MIVRSADARLHLITQADHAALARRIMEYWEPLVVAERRAPILLAVGDHDNGWREPDAAPVVDADSGRIHDFISAPADVRQGVWPRGVYRLANRDRWAAALVAHHAVFVYDRYRSDPAWSTFFTEMEAIRGELVGRKAMDDLLADYRFVRIGDLISLVFCNRWNETQAYEGWTFDLRDAGAPTARTVRGGVDGRVEIAPDPFGGREVPMAIEAREIADMPYHSNAILRDALAAAPIVTLHGAASGPR
jgi:hypothetical protein